VEELKIVGRQNDGFETPLGYRALPGGVLPTADWITQLIMRGFGWHFDVGTGVTPITGGGNGDVFDLDQPEFGISVPDGYVLVPVRMAIAAMPGLQTTDSHVVDVIIAADRAAKWAGDGTVTTETPTNMRTSIAGGCPLQCFSAATADITDPTLGHELARFTGKTDFQGTPADAIIRSAHLLYEPLRPPLIVGPAAVYGYWCGSIAVTGYASLDFLAVPAALLPLLN
jgi:hypothetical protein